MPDSVAQHPTVDHLLEEAMAHYKARRYAEAEGSAREALALRPRDATIWNMRGIFLRRSGRSEAAIPCFREALEIAPDSPGAWSNLGHALKDLKHIESAIACQRHALTLVSTDASHHHDLGVALDRRRPPWRGAPGLRPGGDAEPGGPAAALGPWPRPSPSLVISRAAGRITTAGW